VVDELSLKPDSSTYISLFPNPANYELNIIISDHKSDDYLFYIVDIKGIIIIKEKNFKIDISSLSPGVYIVFGVNKNTYTIGEKLIKK
jgi:hypothetical protein